MKKQIPEATTKRKDADHIFYEIHPQHLSRVPQGNRCPDHPEEWQGLHA